jgi:ABC-2 type transport system permease protein
VRLILSELRLQRLSLLAWLCSLAGLVVLVLAFYPQVRGNTSLDSLYADLSPSLQALLGGSDLSSPVGYLNTQLFAFFLPAVLLVFGIGHGASTLAGEEEARTLDLLMAQPVPRGAVYLQKAGALAVSVSALASVSWLSLVVLDNWADLHLAVSKLAAVCLQLGLFALALAFAAQAIAATTGRRAIGLAGVSGYAVISYVVYGLAQTVSWLQHVRPFTLWRWYLFNDPLRSGFGGREIGVLLATCVIVTGGGALGFGRRDLHN